MRPVSEILVDALASFEGGRRWTKETLFRDEDGEDMILDDRDLAAYTAAAATAETFCAYGAIVKSMIAHNELTEDIVRNKLWQDRSKSLFERVLVPDQPNSDGSIYANSIIDVNDCAPDFEPVREMFCTGIKKALAEEAAADAKEETHVD